MSRRAVALAALAPAIITACTGHATEGRSAPQATAQRQAASPRCGGESVRAKVGSVSVVLHSLERATVTARVGDTLELSAAGPCHDSVHLYEHGSLIAVATLLRLHLAHEGKRVFEADISMCAHVQQTCFGGLSSLGSIEVTTRR